MRYPLMIQDRFYTDVRKRWELYPYISVELKNTMEVTHLIYIVVTRVIQIMAYGGHKHDEAFNIT